MVGKGLKMLTQHILDGFCRGKVVASAEEKETIVYGEVDVDYVTEVRTNIPISKQKRLNVYTSAQNK